MIRKICTIKDKSNILHQNLNILFFLAHIYWSVSLGKTKHTRYQFSSLPLYEFSSLSPCSEYNICKVASRWPRWVRDRQDMRLSPKKDHSLPTLFILQDTTLYTSQLYVRTRPRKRDDYHPHPSAHPPTHRSRSDRAVLFWALKSQ